MSWSGNRGVRTNVVPESSESPENRFGQDRKCGSVEPLKLRVRNRGRGTRRNRSVSEQKVEGKTRGVETMARSRLRPRLSFLPEENLEYTDISDDTLMWTVLLWAYPADEEFTLRRPDTPTPSFRVERDTNGVVGWRTRGTALDRAIALIYIHNNQTRTAEEKGRGRETRCRSAKSTF